MLKIGIARGTGAYHGRAFAAIINRYDEAAFRDYGWTTFAPALADRACVTHVWDIDREDAEKLASAANIEHVADTVEELIGQVDGVLVCDDGSLAHQQSALPFLEAGVPTFVDKPLSQDPDEAERIIETAAANGAPFFSASALRFASAVTDRAQIEAQVGEITAITGAGVNELVYYGIHPLETMLTVMGPGVESVINVGRPGEAIVRLRWRDGRQGVMIVYEEGFSYTLEVTLHGTKGHVRMPVSDSADFYTNMIAAFLDMVETGEPPFPAADTLEIVRVLALAKQSVLEGGVEKTL